MSKRREAIAAITQHSFVNGGVAAMPTPALEAGKHMMYGANEIAMCVRIAHIYFGPHISETDVKEMLLANGLAAVGGGGLAVVGTKVGQTVVSEALNFVPVVGWFFKGALACTITGGLGYAFIKVCEKLSP